MKVTLVAGARPNFMKIAPLIRAFDFHGSKIDWRLVHTGQHYDREMNDVFFEELGIPAPDTSLNCGGGSHAEQTAAVMVAFEKELLEHPADVVVVVGDVNSTLACALVAKKLRVKVAHVEAGLRSGDRGMPEEINRLAADAITDLFFVTEPSGEAHLLREGHPAEVIHHVGHVMIDNLLFQAEKLSRSDTKSLTGAELKQNLQATAGRYGVVTLHRPSNVDEPASLARVVSALTRIAEHLPLVFPVHPRTRARLEASGIELPDRLHLLPPLPYMAFLNLWKDAAVVVTDSGGLQEETTGLGVPCVTVRDSTERPITIDEGTNVLAGLEPDRVVDLTVRALSEDRERRRPKLWDGRAAERIAEILLRAEADDEIGSKRKAA